MRVGTLEHRDLFCKTFIDGHRAYEPETLPWSELEPKYLERLRSIPFWGVARAMERKAGIMVTAFAQTPPDPVIREAVELQGIEKARHVTFFINWFRYEETLAGRDGFLRRHVTAARNYYRSIRELVRTLGGAQTTGFVAVAANDMIEGMTPIMFLEAALAENRRLLGSLDRRLVKPALLPALATVVLTALRALPPRTAAEAVASGPAASSMALDSSVAA
jgi:hypothetical protein